MRSQFLIVGVTLLGAGLYCGPAAGDEERSGDKLTVPEGQPKEIMAKLSKLEGDWVLLDENGEETGVIGSKFRVTPAGSGLMVLEEMFPDSLDGHETINVYQADGERVLITHYCAVANQPQVEVRSTDDENRLELNFDGITNQPSPDADHMRQAEYIFHGEVRQAEYIFHGKNRLTTRWRSMTDGKLSDENSITFELKRKT